jgi:predicted DNA-binding protein YlxM (UPF0122 family)
MTKDFIELKQEVLIMRSIIEEHSVILASIKHISLSDLASNLGVSRQALNKYVQKNLKPNFEYEKRNGKIYIDVCVVPQIRSHYVK